MYKVLVLGSGNCNTRRVCPEGKDVNYNDSEVTKIDIDPNCNPDEVMDLNVLASGGKLPFDDEAFDEIDAFETLEHFGSQGDWRGFFKEFGEYHRVLKKGGQMCIMVPYVKHYFADPGHIRFFHINHFGFLNQEFYKKNIEAGTTATDYRHVWDKNFDIKEGQVTEEHIWVVLEKNG